LRQPGKVEIVEGLLAGEMVVTAGQARLLPRRPRAGASDRPCQAGAAVAAAPGRRRARFPDCLGRATGPALTTPDCHAPEEQR